MAAAVLPVSPPASASSDDISTYACRVCVQRKVKCNKLKPCGSCTKSRLRCEYATTPPLPRLKRRLIQASRNPPHAFNARSSHPRLLEVQQRPFEDLASSGHSHTQTDNIPVQRPLPPIEPITSGLQTPVPNSPPGILIPEDGGSRYYGNGLMGGLSQEYQKTSSDIPRHLSLSHITTPSPGRTRQELSDSHAASILYGHGLPQLQVASHILPEIAYTALWSIFIRNVHPLTKIVHAPTVYRQLFEPAAMLSSANDGHDALKLSLNACAISSLTDKECRETFGESQRVLLQTFQAATRSALLESSFLRIPDINLLRANVLLLTSMLHTADVSSLWILMGSTVRMAQSQGLHRDGAALGLSLFDIEMRRRLWWYIVALDGRLAELTGVSSSLPKSMDTLLPANLDDKELDPAMTTLPNTRVGASEMTFCLLKYEIGRYIQEHDRPSQKSVRSDGKRSLPDLENVLEEGFLRFCDPVVPIQFMSTLVARSAICKLRQLVQHKQSRVDELRTSGLDQSRATLVIATRNVEYHNLIHASRSLRGFLWLANFYFPWGAAISILRYLVSCPDWDDDMRSAWAQIEEVYNNHPEYLETDKVIYSILGSPTLKVWGAPETTLQLRGFRSLPLVVVELQKREAALASGRGSSGADLSGNVNDGANYVDFANFNQGTYFADLNGFDTINFDNYDYQHSTFDGVDWSSIAG